ncbi:MAG: hypothetical protein KC636_25880 [Myxococcales bacterium]|nr:hypothetical protein [Myxococcales bacterium]
MSVDEINTTCASTPLLMICDEKLFMLFLTELYSKSIEPEVSIAKMMSAGIGWTSVDSLIIPHSGPVSLSPVSEVVGLVVGSVIGSVVTGSVEGSVDGSEGSVDGSVDGSVLMSVGSVDDESPLESLPAVSSLPEPVSLSACVVLGLVMVTEDADVTCPPVAESSRPSSSPHAQSPASASRPTTPIVCHWLIFMCLSSPIQSRCLYRVTLGEATATRTTRCVFTLFRRRPRSRSLGGRSPIATARPTTLIDLCNVKHRTRVPVEIRRTWSPRSRPATKVADTQFAEKRRKLAAWGPIADAHASLLTRSPQPSTLARTREFQSIIDFAPLCPPLLPPRTMSLNWAPLGCLGDSAEGGPAARPRA